MLRQRGIPQVASTRFRTDIEGLRAVSVMAVLLWHAGLSWIPGGYVGVDVFFVISGYLMTSILLKEGDRSGRVSLTTFYACRIRRLLPAAIAALLGTVLLTLAFLPRQRWHDIGWDMVTAAGYVLNWRMSEVAVDYLAQSEPPSPLQHYWSLAVEEQFYLFWPAVVLAVYLLSRRLRLTSSRPMLWGAGLLLVAGSLGLCIALTQSSATSAYFVTYTRAWELGLGTLVALGASWWPRLPTWLATILGWVGLAAVLISIGIFDSQTPFPGYAALLPTVGAALVIIAGPAARRSGPVRVLEPRVMQKVGQLSYSLYLWHWPFVVVAMSLFGDGHDVSAVYGVGAVLLSVPAAWACFRYVEQPFRGHPRQARDTRWLRQSLVLGWNCSIVGVLVGGLLILFVWPGPTPSDPRWRVVAAASNDSGADIAFGAIVLGSDPVASRAGEPVDDPGVMSPSPRNIASDLPAFRPQGCQADFAVVEVTRCQGGDLDGKVTIALIGDSHAAQWVTALDLAGRRQGWRIVSMTKVSCPAGVGLQLDRLDTEQPYTECTQWNDRLRAEVVKVEPDVVLISNAAGYAVDEADIGATLVQRVRQFEQDDLSVAVVRDNPRPEQDMADCIQDNLGKLRECAFDREGGLQRAGKGQTTLLQELPELEVIDLTDYICPQESCAPVIGGVSVYRDTNHLSATYVASLSQTLEDRVTSLLDGQGS